MENGDEMQAATLQATEGRPCEQGKAVAAKIDAQADAARYAFLAGGDYPYPHLLWRALYSAQGKMDWDRIIDAAMAGKHSLLRAV